jgi:putative membrane protein
MPHEYFWWGPMWIFPMMMPVIVLVVLLVALYLIFGRSGDKRPPWEPQERFQETPLEILKKRYAQGEITREEFEQIKKDILS